MSKGVTWTIGVVTTSTYVCFVPNSCRVTLKKGYSVLTISCLIYLRNDWVLRVCIMPSQWKPRSNEEILIQLSIFVPGCADSKFINSRSTLCTEIMCTSGNCWYHAWLINWFLALLYKYYCALMFLQIIRYLWLVVNMLRLS